MPHTHYCWRCKTTLPFLTPEEWSEVRPLLMLDIERIKAYRSHAGVSLPEALSTLQHRACQRYFELTGFKETNPNALWHHHLDLYGRECPACSHLLRTPQAAFCANCGWRDGVRT